MKSIHNIFIYLIILFFFLLVYLFFSKIIRRYKYKDFNKLQLIGLPLRYRQTIDDYLRMFIPTYFINDEIKYLLRYGCPIGHVPIKDIKSNLYNKDKTFIIVQHPYELMISNFQEFRLGCKKFWPQDIPYISYHLFPGQFLPHCSCTAKNLNEFIQAKLKLFKKNNYINDCHYFPQYQYIWNSKGQKVCRYILKYENLENDFNQLMRKYNLPGRKFNLKPANNKVLRKRFNCLNLSREHLYPETKKLIQQVYQKDFELLGYSK